MGDDNSTLTFFTETLPEFTVGEDYDQIIYVEGGSAPYSFSIESGEFPDGIQFDNNGVVAGTPADDAADTTVFITATDGMGTSVTQAFDCEVHKARHDEDEESEGE